MATCSPALTSSKRRIIRFALRMTSILLGFIFRRLSFLKIYSVFKSDTIHRFPTNYLTFDILGRAVARPYNIVLFVFVNFGRNTSRPYDFLFGGRAVARPYRFVFK